ncbi:MAG: TetR/AcrR family transcriptional regulator [Deltaproteobacteria bacterium]|nr:TetR/AcrR family transcriptional regulator [Deltaproteobacteria bacterium]
MEERARRIIETAVQLAEEGGFEAVRLRDVAAQSGVALGTLYNRFRSKEDILVAGLELEARKFEELMAIHPARGATPTERVVYFFTLATRAMVSRPNFARAVLRAVASGVPDTAEKVLRHHGRITRLVAAAMRGELVDPDHPATLAPDEDQMGFLLQQIWFAALVGWMGGLQDVEGVIAHMKQATELLLSGREG